MAMVQPRSVGVRRLGAHLALICFVSLIVFPLLLVISISFREGNFATGSLIPENFSLEHWSLAATTSAYAFARMHFKGKAPLLKGMLIFQMFPAVLSLVALYISGRSKVISNPSMARLRKLPWWMAPALGKRFATFCCRSLSQS